MVLLQPCRIPVYYLVSVDHVSPHTSIRLYFNVGNLHALSLSFLTLDPSVHLKHSPLINSPKLRFCTLSISALFYIETLLAPILFPLNPSDEIISTHIHIAQIIRKLRIPVMQLPFVNTNAPFASQIVYDAAAAAATAANAAEADSVPSASSDNVGLH